MIGPHLSVDTSDWAQTQYLWSSTVEHRLASSSFLYSSSDKPNRMWGNNRWPLTGKGKKQRTGGQVEEVEKEGLERARERQVYFCSCSPPVTALSCCLPACSLANTAASDKEQPLSYSGVPPMFRIINCTEMPMAYKEGSYMLERATNSTLLPISLKLALRPAGSLKNNKTT